MVFPHQPPVPQHGHSESGSHWAGFPAELGERGPHWRSSILHGTVVEGVVIVAVEVVEVVIVVEDACT